MLVTLSTAAVFGVGTVALIWTKRVGPGTALIVFLGGFTLASTGLAGPVNDLITAAITAIGSHK